MTAANRLIVALDVSNLKALEIVQAIVRQTNVGFFKLSVSNLLSKPIDLMAILKDLGADVMLDLKIYDTPDSVCRITTDAFIAGARFVTVHPDCTIPAEQALEKMPNWGDERRILPVLELTSGSGTQTFDQDDEFKYPIFATGAAVCPPYRVGQVRRLFKGATIVCPGIRQTVGGDDGHVETWGPAATIRAGADYLVVGRPIIAAPDPVEAVLAIIEELENDK